MTLLRFLLRSLTIVAILLSCTLAHAAPPQWTEVRSQNFSVLTDAGERRGRDIALRFEQQRAVFGYLFKVLRLNAGVPLQIIAFKNRKQFQNFGPKYNGKPVEMTGFFVAAEDRNFIAIDASSEDDWRWHIVFHEYAHLLLNANFRPFPVWFDEGFAEYYSTTKVLGKDVQVGLPPDGAGQMLNSMQLMPVTQLFSIKHNSREYNESGNKRSLLYLQSWLIVHYMQENKLMGAFQRYSDLVANGTPVAEAIRTGFHMEPAQFDQAIKKYLQKNALKLLKFPMPPLDGATFTARALSDIDARVELAELHAHNRDYAEQSIAEFEAILKLQPDNTAAHCGLGYAHYRNHNFATAAEHFRRAADLNSKDSRAYYYLAVISTTQPGQRETPESIIPLLEKAIALNPNFAESYSVLAFAQQSAAQPEAALASMNRAIQLNPANERYQINAAQLLMSMQKFDEARSILTRLAGSRDESLASSARHSLASLELMEQRHAEVDAHRNPAVEISPVRIAETGDDGISGPPGAITVTDVRVATIEGTLVSVVCGAPKAATLRVTSGTTTWTLRAPDRDRITLTGAEAFSCAWKNRSVKVKIRVTGPTQGEVVTLDLR